MLVVVVAVVTLLLLAIWFFSTGQPPGFTAAFWPVWPILGMSIAAIFVGLDAYGITRQYISEEDVDAEIARMTKKPTPPTDSAA